MMRVFVTGAAGQLGSHLCRQLAEAGDEAVAVDVRYRADLPGKLHLLDLAASPLPLYRLIETADAVVHLATLPGPATPQEQFAKNVTMTMNVFQTAIEVGVRRLLFASSIQVVAGSMDETAATLGGPMPPYLPLDNDLPAEPANPYSMNKLVGEQLLDYYHRRFGSTAVAFRFPWLGEPQQLEADQQEPPMPLWLRAACSYLPLPDAARLVVATLKQPLEGVRIYMPAARGNLCGKPLADLVQTYYPQVPLRKSLDQMTSLIDLTEVEAETGWSPSQ